MGSEAIAAARPHNCLCGRIVINLFGSQLYQIFMIIGLISRLMGYYEFKFSHHPYQRLKLTEIVLLLTANLGVLPVLSWSVLS